MSDSSDDVDDEIFTQKYSDSVPALCKAVMHGDLDKIKRLILQGHLPQTPDNTGWTSIHCCAATNQIQALKLILKLRHKNKKYLVNLKTWEGITPLMVATNTSRSSVKMCKLLLKAGADPKQCTPTNLTPLHFACKHLGNIDCVKLLVKYGANVNAQEDFDLFTPLHFAIGEATDLEVVKFLINLTDLKLKNSSDRTPFLEACQANFMEAVEVFLNLDKRFANTDSDFPALVHAALSGNANMAQTLIEAGADVNCKCKAMVLCETDYLECFLFDRKTFLPIHSSLKSLEVFILLLNSCNPQKLLELESKHYTFSLFVFFFSDDRFFEHLLESDLPDKLKTFDTETFAKFTIKYCDVEGIFCDRFQDAFKYNFSLTPEGVFCEYARNLNKKKIKGAFSHLHLLGKMGISSVGSSLDSKQIIFKLLEEHMKEADSKDLTYLQSIHDLLSVSVLTLKQLSRLVLRDQIKSSFKCDRLALRAVIEANLPITIKKFILFESLV